MESATNPLTAQQNRNTRVISVTSGKGGVGKSNTIINLALQLALRGKKVFLVDADLGLANIDILLNLTPKYTIDNVLTGKKNLEDVIIEGPLGIHVLPGSSGISEISELTSEQQMTMLIQLNNLQNQACYDYILIDTGAGISTNVLRFNASVDEICIITTPEPTAMTDAYALIKIMAIKYQIRQFNLIVNQATEEEAKSVHHRLEQVSMRFLSIALLYLGHIPSSHDFNQAIRLRQPMSLLKPSSTISKAYIKIADLIDNQHVINQSNETNNFWQKLAVWKKK